MSSVQLLLTLSLWYLPGALVARAMIRRGHEPARWVFVAWIGGLLGVVAAIVCIAHPSAPTRRPERIAPPDRSTG